MEFGMFMMPAHPPERAMYDGIQQDVDEIVWLDELGFSEVWVGEHLTAPWEPYPAGDLIIAQALGRTTRIKVCSGAYIPTYYQPAPLALRIAQLDHMAQGRYMCGIAVGAQPADYALIGLDVTKNEPEEKTFEAVDIMKKMWKEHVGHTWTLETKYWGTIQNGLEYGNVSAHIETFQKPHPPLAIAGMRPDSASIRWAGANGAIPLSVLFNIESLKSHWNVYSTAAAEAGLVADRADWRIQREVFVAETDEEAKNYVRNSNQARLWNEFYIPLFKVIGWTKFLKHDPSVTDDEIDIEYLIKHLWLVGSPETVADKLIAVHDAVGGFGTVLNTKYDWGTNEDPRAHSAIYRRYLELMSQEVMPRVNAAVSLPTLQEAI